MRKTTPVDRHQHPCQSESRNHSILVMHLHSILVMHLHPCKIPPEPLPWWGNPKHNVGGHVRSSPPQKMMPSTHRRPETRDQSLMQIRWDPIAVGNCVPVPWTPQCFPGGMLPTAILLAPRIKFPFPPEVNAKQLLMARCLHEADTIPTKRILNSDDWLSRNTLLGMMKRICSNI